MWIKILLLFFAFSFIFKTDFSFDQDLGRHLKLGEIIWQTKNIPNTNLFSYTNPDFPFINTHWLFEVWAYLTSQALGLDALLIIKVIILLTSVWLILKIVPNNQSLLLLPIGYIFLHVLRERTELRPEIFSFFFTAFTFYSLDKYLKNSSKLIYFLPLIQLLWINTHIYFFVGLILQTIFILQTRFKSKILNLVFILSIIVSLINPNGISGLTYPLNVTKNYGYTIVENQTMFLLESINFKDPNFLFVKIALTLIALSLITAFIKRKFEIRNILLALLGGTLALLNVRSFPYLIFISLPAVVANFNLFKSRFLTTVLVTGVGILILMESFYYLNGQYYLYHNESRQPELKLSQSGQKALNFVIDNKLPQPIYNNFDIGSYIIYRGYPDYKVFVDGRPEGYPQHFFSQVYIPSQSDYANFKQLDKKLNFQTIIFSHTDQTPWGKSFLSSVVLDKDWSIVYLDGFIIVLVKTNYLTSAGLNLQAIDLSKLDPNLYSFNSSLSYLKISIFLIQSGNPAAAQRFAEKALTIFPQSPLGNALFNINIPNKFFW